MPSYLSHPTKGTSPSTRCGGNASSESYRTSPVPVSQSDTELYDEDLHSSEPQKEESTSGRRRMRHPPPPAWYRASSGSTSGSSLFAPQSHYPLALLQLSIEFFLLYGCLRAGCPSCRVYFLCKLELVFTAFSSFRLAGDSKLCSALPSYCERSSTTLW